MRDTTRRQNDRSRRQNGRSRCRQGLVAKDCKPWPLDTAVVVQLFAAPREGAGVDGAVVVDGPCRRWYWTLVLDTGTGQRG